ncbi:ABC transporter ATP-binding protein [Aurantimonas marianensis]|uniref:ABC transporter ATP-binding protein n=1 Tax=Aurantimonas marianensis TaxID=2920428 RepID=A0A9X2HH82_9HYPH|nr:ABC transporter ATP-binding protein [Aurantimonas marianensis]MCP3056969.1 ABC transporter ATP-binding protein [Aurantimonas marianensis]
MSGEAIRAEALVKTFRDRKARALDGLDIAVQRGDMTAIVGPSGSGKSTLLYALSGLTEVDSGRIAILGERPADAADWTNLRARRIGLVFQEDWLLPTLTAAENIELPMLGLGASSAERQSRVRGLLDAVKAEGFGDHWPAGLSGGERQRIAVARGLANRPEILLADEPTGELDSVNSRAIIDLLVRLRAEAGLTVLIVTHDETVAAACQRRFQVIDGRGRYVS